MSVNHAVERPVGGRILTPWMILLLAISAAAAIAVVWRLLFGLGSISYMNDGFPWGIWKPLNVVTFTGVGAGAYGCALLAYVLNKGRYHPLVRSAVITGAMAYTLAGTSVLVDLGRWWNLWVLFFPPIYNVNSILLEVAVCVLTYCIVLWVEMVPVVLEFWRESQVRLLKRLAMKYLPFMQKVLPWIFALAIVLPTMHQSSLGGLYMVAVTKLHPLWLSPWISMLFLLSCLTMGYSSVVVIETITSLVYPRERDDRILFALTRVATGVQFAYVALRLGDLTWRGEIAHAFQFDKFALLFWGEMALFLVAPIAFLWRRARENPGWIFGWSLVMAVAGALYRFDTYLIAFRPGTNWHYFPSLGEMLFSAGLLACGIAVYIASIKRFPILSGVLRSRPPEVHGPTTGDAASAALSR